LCARNLSKQFISSQNTHLFQGGREVKMPGLTHRKGPVVSLVQDQDIYVEDEATADLTITVVGAVEADGTKYVTDVHVSNKVCRASRYLQPIIDTSDDATEITLGGELKRSGNNTNGKDEGENREGLLVVLAHLHGLNEEQMEALGLYKISVLGVWYAISATLRRPRSNPGSSNGMPQA
jgi:hypothetical protein